MNTEYAERVFGLNGKKAIVTGASQGIGEGVAISLAMMGAEVCVVGRNEKLLKSVQGNIKRKGGICEYAMVDISKPEETDAFFQEYEKKHNRLDIFVNNAGFTVHAEITDTNLCDIDALISTNLRGAIYCIQNAAIIMKKHNKGTITIVSSVNALNAHPKQGMYSVTKAGLEGAMKAFASSLAEYNIRVNSVAPGAIDTAMNKVALSDEEIHKAVIQKIAMRRVGGIEDIGDVVAAVCSDAFRYTTGATIVVDGGMLLKQK